MKGKIISEDIMPIAVMTSKGQMTIPKEVRKALGLKPAGKVIILVELGNEKVAFKHSMPLGLASKQTIRAGLSIP